MAANPEPRYYIILENAEGSVPAGYSDGPDVLCCIDAFKMEGWMKGILLPQPVRFARTFSDGLRERFIRSPERGDCG
jgi:hypothetical protein